MPIFAGQPFYDASGNAMTDASGNAIGEPDLPISLLGGLIVVAGQNPLEDVLEFLGDLVDWTTGFADILGNAGAIQHIMTQQDADGDILIEARDDVNYWLTNNRNTSQNILDAIEGIAAGGLTVDEHNQLFALENAVPSEIADAVWHQLTAVSGLDDNITYWTYQELIQNIFATSAIQLGYGGLPVSHSPYYAVVSPNPIGLVDATFKYALYSERNWPAEPDFTEVLDGDTPYTFLARTQPAYGWQAAGPTGVSDGEIAWKPLNDTYGTWFRSTFSTRQLANVFNETTIINNTAAISVELPLWPGIADVTLGTPVALTGQLNLQEACDGVIVTITTPPTKTGLRQLGGAYYDYGVGELAFESDNGDLEPWQYMGFRNAIFTPRSMLHAAGVRFRILAGAEGTVTPWVRS